MQRGRVREGESVEEQSSWRDAPLCTGSRRQIIFLLSRTGREVFAPLISSRHQPNRVQSTTASSERMHGRRNVIRRLSSVTGHRFTGLYSKWQRLHITGTEVFYDAPLHHPSIDDDKRGRCVKMSVDVVSAKATEDYLDHNISIQQHQNTA